MRAHRFIFLLLFVSALTLSRLAFADFDSGYNAYRSGDYAKALEIWTKASEPKKSPDLWSAYMAGVLHETGRGTKRNISAARALYTKVYRKLPTIIADKPKRKEALSLPIDAVFRFAMIKYAEARRREEKPGSDPKGKMVLVHQEARIMLDRAGFYGHAEAFYNRAVITELGVGRNFLRDKKTAWALYTLSGKLGFKLGAVAAHDMESELSERNLTKARKILTSYQKYMVAEVGYKWRNVTGMAPLVLTRGDASMPVIAAPAVMAPAPKPIPAVIPDTAVMPVRPVSPLEPVKPALRKSVRSSPVKPAGSTLDKGWAAIKGNDFRRAIRLFTQVRKSAPDNLAPLWGRAWAYENVDDLSAAVRDYSAILERAPNDEAARFNRAMAHYQNGSYVEAATDMAPLLVSVDQPRRQFALIWYYLSRRQQAPLVGSGDAASELARLVRDTDLDGDLGSIIGVYLGWANPRRLGRAVGNGRSSAERRRQCIAFYHLGMHHLLNGELPRARRYFGKAIATGVVSLRQSKLAARGLAQLRAGK